MHRLRVFIVARYYVDDYITKPRLIQGTGAVLRDKRTAWKIKKLYSLAVSDAFLSEKYAKHVYDCGSTLCFGVDPTGKMRLYRASFCRNRMCPICQWRRSLVIFHQVKQVCMELERLRPTVRFIMLTLTVPNVSANQLRDEISHLTESLKKLFRKKEVKRAVLGYFRSLEITYNKKRDDYHPHFHVLIPVKSDYFDGRNYISRDEWLAIWQVVTGYSQITQVDVRAIKAREYVNKDTGEVEMNPIASAVAEAGKYVTKPADYITKKGKDFYQANGSVVNLLSYALKGKRLIGWGGDLDKIRKALSLENAEGNKVDLVDTGSESESIKAVSYYLYRWVPGLKNYVN